MNRFHFLPKEIHAYIKRDTLVFFLVLNEQEKIQIQLELQKCQDEMMNVKNDLVSSEARVSFLQDKVQSLETELHGARRERNQVEQALVDARKDLERDELVFAEKIRQMAELQKKATQFYKDKKNLKEEIISLKAEVEKDGKDDCGEGVIKKC